MVANFQLLNWGNAQATPGLPSATGTKPSAPAPATGDWLIFTADDQTPGATHNPLGALSHNFVDLGGAGGAGFNMAPSLSGTLSMEFTDGGSGIWNISVAGLSYSGQANAAMFMNQSLVTPGGPAVPGVDGVGNSGVWNSSHDGGWTVHYQMDFFFASNADGNPAPNDADAGFNNAIQNGYLLPVSLLNPAGLAGLSLNDPAGMYGGDFASYLLSEIAPRLPGDATYLLVTQMAKTHPDYVEAGLPITTSSLIGNTTFAYTTAVIPEPSALALTAAGALWLTLRRRKRTERDKSPLRLERR